MDSTSARTPRVGLSDYTTQKLAELRARRAELDSDYTEYKSAGLKGRSDSLTTASATVSASSQPTSTSSSNNTTAPSTSDLLESYRARRGLPSANSNSSLGSSASSSPTHATRQQVSSSSSASSNGITATTANGTASNALSSLSSSAKNGVTSSGSTTTRSGSSLSSSTSATKSLSSSASSRVGSGSSESKLSNGHVGISLGKPTGGSSLSLTASFSKADYTSFSRSNGVDHMRGGSTSLSRSVSARVTPNPLEDDDDCVGFASLPEQVHRKAVKRGFDFTLMVVGETGLGKSTLISSLFLNTDLYKDREIPSVQERLSKTVRIEKKYMEIEEKGVKLRLSIVDTPGFNDAMDSEQTWKPVEEYINTQFEQYFKDESGLNRKNIKDNRVHCCLYFVSPYGHGLRPIDIQFMRRLHEKVNIVPIIAKADTLTPAEVKRMKDKVLEQVEQHRIKIYEFPDCDSDEDEDFKQQDAELKASIPFAVIGSNTVVEVGGRKVRGRLYPWGVVEVDNPEHCDFSKLRMMLISTHMQDLKDVTRDIHYENYRARHIKEQMTRSQRERNKLVEPEDFYKQNLDKYNKDSKLKRDSSPNFESIIDQDKLLEQKDEEIRQMQEMIFQMQEQLKNKGGNGPVPVVGLGNL